MKLFLLDPIDPCYATFYLWHEADAALGFLEGEFFSALSDAFGRPEVKLLLTKATDLPFLKGESVSHQANPAHAASSLLHAFDPSSGDIIVLASASDVGRRFEVMYRAIGEL